MHISFAFITIVVVAQTAAGFINIRQATTSTSQCESTCSSANATFTSCTNGGGPGPCVCNEGFLNTLMNCFICSNQIEGITDFSADQAQLDDVVSTCDALGSPLPIVTLPGQNPNRNIDTSALPSVTFPTTTPTGAGSGSGNSAPSATSPSSSGGAGSASSSGGNSSPSATSPAGSSPTGTANSTAAGSSNTSSSTSASSSSSTSPSPSPSPTSGASAFTAMSLVSTLFVGVGLILLL